MLVRVCAGVCVVRQKEKVSAWANQAATQGGPGRSDQGGLESLDVIDTM